MEQKKKLVMFIKVSLIISFFIIFLSFVRSCLYVQLSPPKESICGTRLKKLSHYCVVYEYNKGSLPHLSDWCDLLGPYVEPDIPAILNPVYQCPVDEIGPCSYVMNENIPDGSGGLPADLVLLFESAPGWNQVGGADDVVTDRHGKPGANIAFADGHVEFVKAEDIPILRWTVDE
jgi:prepilin-type processing-associated H-X9-DG protein